MLARTARKEPMYRAFSAMKEPPAPQGRRQSRDDENRFQSFAQKNRAGLQGQNKIVHISLLRQANSWTFGGETCNHYMNSSDK